MSVDFDDSIALIVYTGEFINQNERRPITLIEKKGKEQLAQEEISQERGREEGIGREEEGEREERREEA